MRGLNALVWIIALILSALAMGEPHAIPAIQEEDVLSALMDIEATQPKRPPGPTLSQSILRKLSAWDESEKQSKDKLLKAWEGQALLDVFVAQTRAVMKRLRDVEDDSFKLLALNKQPFDGEADQAIKREILFLEDAVKALTKSLNANPKSMNSRDMKLTMVNLIVRENADRLLAAYGREMIKISGEAPNQKETDAEKRIRALRQLQQSEIKTPEVMNNIVQKIGEKDIYPASYAEQIGLDAMKTFFQVNEGQVDTDSIVLGNELIFNRHVKVMFSTDTMKTYRGGK